MTPHDQSDSTIRPIPSAAPACEQGEWLARCRFDIQAREPLLGADDVLSLASDLWERPDCQLVSPELAVGLLFSDQLRCLSCYSHEHADFSIVCSSTQTDRCPPQRVALHGSRPATAA